MKLFAAWDAAYLQEEEASRLLYAARLEPSSDEAKLRELLVDLTAKRRRADELLALLFDGYRHWAGSLHMVH